MRVHSDPFSLLPQQTPELSAPNNTQTIVTGLLLLLLTQRPAQNTLVSTKLFFCGPSEAEIYQGSNMEHFVHIDQ